LSATRDAVEGAVGGPLEARARRAVIADVRAWLAWQESLATWRRQRSEVRTSAGAPAAAFVALYARGELRGCVGAVEGGAKERLARAFLSALLDTRFGGVRASDRRDLVAEVTYLRAPRFVDSDELSRELELGTHGIGLWRDRGGPVFLLPNVARDSRLDREGMVEALHRKAGPQPGSLFLFESEGIVVRRSPGLEDDPTPRDAAAAWLASLVRPHGAVRFAIDARTGAVIDVGTMHHARAAAVLQALAQHGGHRAAVARGRARMAVEIRRALEGVVVDGWPTAVAEVAGTLAHALRAGVAVRAEAVAYAAEHAGVIAQAPWHAGQVIAALGGDAPTPLWEACLRDLERQSWAPWTVLGMRARGEPAARAERAVRGLVAAVRASAPYEGAIILTNAAEVAVTALTIEALLAYPDIDGARAAILRARSFVSRQQLLASTIPAAFIGGEAETTGAFVATPASSLLRGDVTAHALLASERATF